MSSSSTPSTRSAHAEPFESAESPDDVEADEGAKASEDARNQIVVAHLEAMQRDMLANCADGPPRPLFAVKITDTVLAKDGSVERSGRGEYTGPLPTDAAAMKQMDATYLAGTMATVRARLATPRPGDRYYVIVTMQFSGSPYELFVAHHDVPE